MSDLSVWERLAMVWIGVCCLIVAWAMWREYGGYGWPVGWREWKNAVGAYLGLLLLASFGLGMWAGAIFGLPDWADRRGKSEK